MRVRDIQGITFGVMDAVITLLGVIMGLSVSNNKDIILAGVLVTGIADSFANAAGMFALRSTSRGKHGNTASYCFLSTLGITILLFIPIWILPLDTSLYISVTLGLFSLVIIGYTASKVSKRNPYKLIPQYLMIGMVVSFIAYVIGVVIL